MDDGLDLVLLLSRRLPRLLGGPVIPGTFRHRLRLGRGRGFALASHEGIRWRVRVRGGLSRRGDDGVTLASQSAPCVTYVTHGRGTIVGGLNRPPTPW